jgi:hypothetical protein
MFHLTEAVFRENAGRDELNFIIFKHITMTFCIKNVFLYTNVLPEDGLCRPKHGGEIAMT